MKIARYTLLILPCLFLINLLTYFLIGKQSLRERNVSEMLKSNFENPYDLELEFQLISNLQTDSIFTIQNKIYPVFQIYIDEAGNEKIDDNANEIWKREDFRFDENTVNKILNADLGFIYETNPDSAYELLNENFNLLLDSVSDSINALPFGGKIYSDCEYYYLYKDVTCIIFGNMVISFGEEIKVLKPMYVEQLLDVITVGSDFWIDRREKLIWLFYRWVQIDWIEGNGLGGDITS